MVLLLSTGLVERAGRVQGTGNVRREKKEKRNGDDSVCGDP